MTVPSETNRSGPYNGNGSTTIFGYGFRIVDDNHLRVIKTSAAGVETVLTIDADYTVSDVGDPSGGQIALMVAPAVGETITILRAVPFTQETDLENQGAYYAETVEDALDLAAMRDQQLSEEIDRAVKIPASYGGGADLQLPAPEGDRFIAWNSAGDALRNVDPGELITVVAYGTAHADVFVGDGVTTEFSLASSPGVLANLDVAVGGVTQLPVADYIWSAGTTLTFTSPPADGVKILARYMQALAQGEVHADDVQGFESRVFAQPLSTTGASLSQRFSHVINLQDDCGGVGENVTMNTVALTNAINKAQQSVSSRANMPVGIYVPPGLYKFDAALPAINKSVVIFSDGARSAQLLPVGNFDAFTFAGANGARCGNAGFRNIGMNASAMTGGYAVVADWVVDFSLENFLLADPYNGMKLRQGGSTKIINTLFDGVRGDVGFDARADSGTRNGELDTIDLILFDRTTIQGTLPAIGGASSTVMLRLDGRCHTIQFDGIRLLNCGKGLQTLNTAGLASNLVPRFFMGSSLEIENAYAECLDLQAAREFNPAYLFAAGSHTADGVKLSSSVYGFSPAACNISANYLHGINTNGAARVHLRNPLIYNNSLIGVGLKDGLYVSGSGTIVIEGGLIGKDTTMPSYTEAQKMGVDVDGAFNGILQMRGVDLRGNQTAPLFDNGTTAFGSHVSDCPGLNPIGPSIVSVGASPFTYTAGLTQESVSLYGGSGVVSTVGGIAVANVSPSSFMLQPRQSVTISYTTAPTMAVNKS